LRIFAAIVGLVLILLIFLETFETILQPRRVTRKWRFARFYYRSNWAFWVCVGRLIPGGKRREAMLAFFGPLSLLGLFLAWVVGLIFGFALIHWGMDEPLNAGRSVSFFTYIYLSGTTFFTLGYGDVTPVGHFGRCMAVIEAGLGFAFLAVIISYLPGITQAFSKRETTISLLDARAGSPPSASQLLVRLGHCGKVENLNSMLIEWEQWSSEILESHLSFPVLSYFRSQHDNQSWLATITFILDSCAIVMSEVKGFNPYHAQLTFAMARHAVVDLSLIFRTGRVDPKTDRLPPEKRKMLQAMLRGAGLELRDEGEAEAKLKELRGMYEPFVYGLAVRFVFALPEILVEGAPIDNWQRAPGMKRAPELGSLPASSRGGGGEEHF
jgi:hypothetical protein